MQRVVDFVKERDLFAVPVNLTYQGSDAFSTFLGGMCSLMLCAGWFIFFLFGFLDFV